MNNGMKNRRPFIFYFFYYFFIFYFSLFYFLFFIYFLFSRAAAGTFVRSSRYIRAQQQVHSCAATARSCAA